MSTVRRDPVAETSSLGELVLCAEVARRHYLEDQSKTEMADALGLSRFKVARLLDLARSSGIVRIEINEPRRLDTAASSALQTELGLDSVLVAGPVAEEGAASEAVAALAADLLPDLLSERDVLALPWSRSIAQMAERLHDLPPIDVVQLTGALQVDGVDTSAPAIARAAARTGGGHAHLFFAPLVAEDAEAAAVFRRQREVQAARRQLARVTVAVVAVGAWRRGASTIFDELSPAERREISAAGAVGEIAGVFFDAEGGPVTSPVAERIITLDHAELLAVERVVVLAAGAAKAEAVRAAAAGGLISGLVCDGALARALLS